jgi:hypothetical protein
MRFEPQAWASTLKSLRRFEACLTETAGSAFLYRPLTHGTTVVHRACPMRNLAAVSASLAGVILLLALGLRVDFASREVVVSRHPR